MRKAAWLLLGLSMSLPLHAQTLDDVRFGTLTLYRGDGPPRDLVLFLSGDGGWNLGVVNMARHLAQPGVIVAGIDVRHYLAALEDSRAACVSPAGELSALAQHLQDTLGITKPLEPTLAGYSSGATLVYAALVQSAVGTFKGALGLGFCPDLDLNKPLCAGHGVASVPRQDAKGRPSGVDLLPAKSLPGRWIVLQGAKDQVCPAPPTQQFMAQVPGGEITLLPQVGHGYSVEHNWLPQFEAAFRRIVGGAPPG